MKMIIIITLVYVIVKNEAGISFFLISQNAKLWLVITVI